MSRLRIMCPPVVISALVVLTAVGMTSRVSESMLHSQLHRRVTGRSDVQVRLVTIVSVGNKRGAAEGPENQDGDQDDRHQSAANRRPDDSAQIDATPN